MPVLKLDDCTVDLEAERVVRAGGVVRLTPIEAKLLAWLAANPGRDVARDELLASVWAYADGVVSRAVDATVTRLRAKIEHDPAEPVHLVTVWGVGYRFEPGRAWPSIEPDLDAFFGREGELSAVTAALGARLVTLTGPAGIGKTRLAREVARRVPGAAFVAAAQATDDDALSRLVTPHLGADLLVLDNLEQVIAGAASRIRAWLAARPTLQILATSRERLGVAGECVIEVGPLDPAAARALFVARATELAEDPGPALARLEGVPLAIELAAGLADVLSMSELCARLDRPLDLRDRRRDRPPRHESLRAALDGSWATLSAAERRTLAVASLFRSPFSAALLEEVAGEPVTDALAGLRAKSLVRRGLSLFVAVRAYAAEHLPPGDPAHARYVSWFARRAAEIGPFDRIAPTPEGIGWIERSLDDLDAVRRIALERGDVVSAASVAHATYLVLSLRGPVQAAGAAIDEVLAHADRLPPATRGHLHRVRANVFRLAGDDAGVARHLALGRACVGSDRLLEGRLLAIEGVWRIGEPAVARDVLSRAIAIHREAGDRWFLPASLLNLATALQQLGAPSDEVAALYRDAWRLHLEVGNERSAAIALGNHATVLADRGDLATARDELERALATHRALADRHHEAITLGHLGLVALHAGDLADAREMLGRAVALAREHGGRRPPALRIEPRELAVARHLAGDAASALDAVRLARDEEGPSDFLDLLEAAIRIDLGSVGHARELFARTRDDRLPEDQRAMRPAVAGALSLADGADPARFLAAARAALPPPDRLVLASARLYVAKLAKEAQNRQ